MDDIITKSIKEQRCLAMHYDGHDRVVEPHAYGTTKDGKSVIRAWQTRGGSRSQGTPPWRLFRIDKAQNIHLTDETFETPRKGYSKGDRGMKHIYAEVE